MISHKKFTNWDRQAEKVEVIQKTNYELSIFEGSQHKDKFKIDGKRLKLREASSNSGYQLFFEKAFNKGSLNVLGLKVIRQGKKSIRFGFKCIEDLNKRNEDF